MLPGCWCFHQGLNFLRHQCLLQLSGGYQSKVWWTLTWKWNWLVKIFSVAEYENHMGFILIVSGKYFFFKHGQDSYHSQTHEFFIPTMVWLNFTSCFLWLCSRTVHILPVFAIGQYSLSVVAENENCKRVVKHYRIRSKEDGSFFISPRYTFDHLQDMVDHYKGQFCDFVLDSNTSQ